MKKNHQNGFFMGALVGGVLGAMTAAMLFTTKQGKRVQNNAMEKYGEFQSMAKKMIDHPVKMKRKTHRHKHR